MAPQQTPDVVRDTASGESPATPFYALTAVTVVIAVAVALICIVAFALYFSLR